MTDALVLRPVSGPAAWRGDRAGRYPREWICHLSPATRWGNWRPWGIASSRPTPTCGPWNPSDYPLPTCAAHHRSSGARIWTGAAGSCWSGGCARRSIPMPCRGPSSSCSGCISASPCTRPWLGTSSVTSRHATPQPEETGELADHRTAAVPFRQLRRGGPHVLAWCDQRGGQQARQWGDHLQHGAGSGDPIWPPCCSNRSTGTGPSRITTPPNTPTTHRSAAGWTGSSPSTPGRPSCSPPRPIPEVPRLTEPQIELLHLLDEITADPGLALDMQFQPGDIQWLLNAAALHSRTEYVDDPDPTQAPASAAPLAASPGGAPGGGSLRQTRGTRPVRLPTSDPRTFHIARAVVPAWETPPG